MDATTTRIGDAVAVERVAATRVAEPTRAAAVLEITRFDSFAAQPVAMASYCIACAGGAAA